jgi:hypothetical protein
MQSMTMNFNGTISTQNNYRSRITRNNDKQPLYGQTNQNSSTANLQYISAFREKLSRSLNIIQYIFFQVLESSSIWSSLDRRKGSRIRSLIPLRIAALEASSAGREVVGTTGAIPVTSTTVIETTSEASILREVFRLWVAALEAFRLGSKIVGLASRATPVTSTTIIETTTTTTTEVSASSLVTVTLWSTALEARITRSKVVR